MAGQIRITPDEMRARAGEVHGERDTFQGVIGKMQSVINNLLTEWEGAASTSFSQQFEDLKPAFNSMEKLLDDMGGQLYATAQAVEELDQGIAEQYGIR